MPRRVLLIALDALDIGLLRKAFALGRLPNLRTFAENSLQPVIHSDGEIMEGSVWPTFASGTRPGSHGHHWFMQWMSEDASFVPASDPRLAYDQFWKAALDAGKRVTIFDLPYVKPVGHPLERTYTGWGVQDEMEEHAHPASFRKEILRKHGRSLTRKDTMLVHTPADRLLLAKREKASARQRSKLLLDLASRRDWDLLIYGYGEFHRAGHHLALPMQLRPDLTNEAAMMSIVQPLDDALPAIVAAAGEDCDIAFFALHGMQAKVPFGSALHGVLDDLQGKEAAPAPPPDLLRRIRDRVPARLHEEIWLRLPAAMRMNRVAKGWLYHMDLERDRIWMLEGDCAVAFRMNVAGRERHGTVPEGEARAIAEAFLAEIRRYRTPSGDVPFDQLIWTDDRFPGPRSERLPDFTVTYHRGVVHAESIVRDDGRTHRNGSIESRNGSHTDSGFVFYRPAGDAALRRGDIRTEDLAPTVLERLGVTPSAELAGERFLG